MCGKLSEISAHFFGAVCDRITFKKFKLNGKVEYETNQIA